MALDLTMPFLMTFLNETSFLNFIGNFIGLLHTPVCS